MKVQLTFDLPEEQEAFDAALRGGEALAKIEEIYQQVFRPAFKHGYSGTGAERLNALLEGEHRELCFEIVELLRDRYSEIVHDD